jgi:hypothetical protein
MSIETFEQVPPLLPLEFFSLHGTVRSVKGAPGHRGLSSAYRLPDTSELLAEERFAEVALGWNEEGIYVDAWVDKPIEEVAFPHFSKGDALELFFDTRDLKTAGFATRFCHHFLFLPQPFQEIQAQEMTHFRTEDTHPLCDPNDLKVSAASTKRAYSLHLFIPAHCLHGYDPHNCPRLGFTYRIHRYAGPAQHFALSSEHFALEQTPRLWASLALLT